MVWSFSVRTPQLALETRGKTSFNLYLNDAELIESWCCTSKFSVSIILEQNFFWNVCLCTQNPLLLTYVCILSILFSYISYGSDKNNLFNNQERLLLVIISFILNTLVFYSVVILRGEMKC